MLADTFNILGEPTRLGILNALRESALAVGELVELLQKPQPTVSKHLKVLREAGFVHSRVDAQRRIYAINPEPFRELDDWLRTYSKTWNTSLDQLETFLDQEEE